MQVVKISGAQHQAVGASSRDRFVVRLMDDLARRYPERCGLMPPPALRHYVEQRVDYAAHYGVTRQDAVATLAFAECSAGVDFLRGAPGDWWHDILAQDMDQADKVRMLDASANHLEADPAFHPAFD